MNYKDLIFVVSAIFIAVLVIIRIASAIHKKHKKRKTQYQRSVNYKNFKFNYTHPETHSNIQNDRKGRNGENEVATILKYVKNSYCINNCRLPLYDNITEIDHVLIGDFGVVVIETKSIGGSLCGNVNDKNLIQYIGSREHTVYNPVMQNETHIKNVKYHLTKMGYRNVPIYSVIVFTDVTIDINIQGKTNAKVIKINRLQDYINMLPRKIDYIPYYRIYNSLLSISDKKKNNMERHNNRINSLYK